MRDNCYIDGVSAWNVFGVHILRRGYGDLLLFPAMKTPDSNDWPEENGQEVDLSAPRLEAKEVSIPFLAGKRGREWNDFVDFISTPGYRILYIPSLGREWNVRLTGQPAHRTYPVAAAFTLRFAQDIPLRAEATADPHLLVRKSLYEIDGVPLDRYGIVVESARDSLLKSSVAKKSLSREIKTVEGQIYDAGSLVFESKEVAFTCFFKTASMEKFWSCYDAFFYALTLPGERELYVDYTGETYPCYYKSTSAWTLHPAGDFILVEFTLTMVFSVFRVEKTQYILATEKGEWIITEDGEYAIDLEEEYGN
jgi:hypothetical protein